MLHIGALGERALFLESHHNCFIWIDEWFGMTEEAIREFERGSCSLLNEATSGKILQYFEIDHRNLTCKPGHQARRNRMENEDVHLTVRKSTAGPNLNMRNMGFVVLHQK
ncbi:phosphatidylinositol transfer protein 4-like isoform X2 [Camellia sinensis]|uniref:phosphatidylinositol transfer protein 4-like isoform X2 n=1 Tax=Camellia sinensis TaxID=4442 RepID=UPI0010366CCC|nr:phosphatidylinositol transfer protein 4-like isoform X2 [Camellia sinensis]